MVVLATFTVDAIKGLLAELIAVTPELVIGVFLDTLETTDVVLAMDTEKKLSSVVELASLEIVLASR
jgi:hypothetical protein